MSGFHLQVLKKNAFFCVCYSAILQSRTAPKERRGESKYLFHGQIAYQCGQTP